MEREQIAKQTLRPIVSGVRVTITVSDDDDDDDDGDNDSEGDVST